MLEAMEKPKSPGTIVGNVPDPSNHLPKNISYPMAAVVGTAKAMPFRKSQTSDLRAQGEPMTKLRHNRLLLIDNPRRNPEKMESILSLIESGVTGLTLTMKSEDLVSFAKHLIEAAKEELLPIMKKADKEDFMTKKEVVKLFGICPTTLWNWEKKGYLVPIRVEDSRKIHYLRSDIEEIIKKRGL